MTKLLAFSNMLILLAAVLLFFGWVGANGVLIWGSIASSALSFVLLALAYSKSRVG